MKKLCTIFVFLILSSSARADLWGADIPILSQILAQTITQVKNTIQLLGNARDTLSVLQEMNRGVKEVLRLAETAHIPLPPQVYENAKNIDDATKMAEKAYGVINNKAPISTKANFKSGVEGLFLSQDTIDYSSFLDKQASQVKAAAIISSQATATRLSAETLGVLVHAVSHTNRIEAKQLELDSTKRMEDSAKENAEYEAFVQLHGSVENEIRRGTFSSLSKFSKGGN